MRTFDTLIALLIGEINERNASIIRARVGSEPDAPQASASAWQAEIDKLSKACNCLMNTDAATRVRAHVIALENWQTNVCFTQIYKDEISKLYRGGEYSHVDVYSPAEAGETLLYRVKL